MTISTKMPSVRSIASRLCLLGFLVACSCTREAEDVPAASAEAPGPAPATKAESAAAPAAEVPPSSLGAGLDEALERAVVAPASGGSNYRVDAFVAALVFAAVEHEAERWFSPFSGTPAKVDYEVRGFTLTAAGERAGLMRVGLREGDIVETVNGVPATDAATIRGALAGSDAGITVGVFREDYSFVLGYRFEPGLAWMRTREDAGIDVAGAPAVVAAAEDEDVPRGSGASSPSPSSGSTPSSPPAGSGSGAKPSASGSTPRPSTPKASPSSPSSGSGTSGSSSVTCTSDSTCTIRKSVFDSMVSSPSKLESQAKIVPAIQNDVFSGYKLSWIRPGSAIDQMGFKSGDKITHVNGRDLTDDADAFALYLSLSSTRSYKIKYLRGGASRTKNVDVK